MTDEEKVLYKRLKSRVWRLNNLYWVQDEMGVKRKFRMRWSQREMLANLWYLNVILKVRQIGISTFTELLILDRNLFFPDQTCGIVDWSLEDAKKKLAKIKFAYEHLDDPDDPATASLGALVKQACRLVVDNKQELEFSNGSKVWAGTSLRGSTVNLLHVSELGTIAYRTPKRALEIAAGSFNTVHAGSMIIVESTHEGGRYGLNYELVRVAQKTNRVPRGEMTELDWRFHFFPWWREPNYVLPLLVKISITKEQAEYFKTVEEQNGIKLTPEQKHWYVKKAATPKVDMARQYPASSEEALQAVTPGAIYGKEILSLRRAGRVRDFQIDGHAPLFTSWDIGISDFCCIWLLQMVGREILVIDYITFHGEKPSFYGAKCIEWERHYERPIANHYLPHDAAHKLKIVSGKSWLDMLAEAGLRAMKIVPRTPDYWVGIQHLRSLFPRFIFHATNCEKDQEMPDGQLLPSGLGALSGYHTVVESVGGVTKEEPVHDAASHGSDAMRTFAEAHARGMLDGVSAVAKENRMGRLKVQMGLRQPNVGRRPADPSDGPQVKVMR